MELEQIKGRIRKLLALAGSANENEAAAAAAKAQALCDQYNLELASIGLGKEQGPSLESACVSPHKYRREAWEYDLAALLAEACDCEHWMEKVQRGPDILPGWHFMAVGYVADVTLLGYLQPYLERTMLALYREALAKHRAQFSPWYWSTRDTNAFRRGFMRGCTRRVISRLLEMRETRRVAPETRALVVVKKEAVQDWVADNLGELHKVKINHNTDISATGMSLGLQAADGICLDRPLEDREAPRQGGFIHA